MSTYEQFQTLFAYTTFELGTTIIEPSSKCAKMHLFAIYLAFLRYVKHFENTHPNQNITDEMIKPRLKIQPLLKAGLNVSKTWKKCDNTATTQSVPVGHKRAKKIQSFLCGFSPGLVEMG